MATTHYGFQEVVGTNNIDLVSDINTPLGQIDTTIYNLASARRADFTDFVVVGDSWSTLNNPLYGGTVWHTYVANKLNQTVHVYAANSVGFVANSSTTTTFPIEATNAANDTTYNHNNVGIVYLVGGVNDASRNIVGIGGSSPTNSAYYTAINDTITTLTSAFPNATIYFIPNYGCNFHQYTYNYLSYWSQQVLVHSNTNVAYCPNFMHYCIAYTDIFQSDHLHLNNYGNMQFSNFALNPFSRPFHRMDLSSSGNITLSKNGDVLELYGNCTNGTTLTMGYGLSYAVGSLGFTTAVSSSANAFFSATARGESVTLTAEVPNSLTAYFGETRSIF